MQTVTSSDIFDCSNCVLFFKNMLPVYYKTVSLNWRNLVLRNLSASLAACKEMIRVIKEPILWEKARFKMSTSLRIIYRIQRKTNRDGTEWTSYPALTVPRSRNHLLRISDRRLSSVDRLTSPYVLYNTTYRCVDLQSSVHFQCTDSLRTPWLGTRP